MRWMALTLSLVVLSHCAAARAADGVAQDGWISLFDGKTLSGWRAGGHADSITARDGMIVCNGPPAYLYYVGDVENADFKNFHLKAAVMTRPGANSGIYFHTTYRESGSPTKGYEAQIHNTYTGQGHRELRKTGSLYGVRNQYKSIARDDEWFTMHVAVTGKRIRVSVNDVLVVDYTEPAQPLDSQKPPQADRRPSHGTFALQCHDAHSQVFFKDIYVKPLPDDVAAPPGATGIMPVPRAAVDQVYSEIQELQSSGFPLVDFHVHLKGGLTLEEALENSRRTGINYGIAPNCGLGFPITDDAGIYKFIEAMQGQPAFLGMQAEGREWVNMFSKQAIARFDYVFTDAMTFTDDRGKRIRLWVKDEVQIDDEQAFMDMYVERILSVLNNEPIDIYVNPTFLPACIADEYDALWTEERMQKVIDAAARNNVAIEINARLRLPKAAFIKRAKKAGVKFSFGTNNSNRNLGRLEYCLEMIKECGLTSSDMFMPAPRSHGCDDPARPSATEGS